MPPDPHALPTSERRRQRLSWYSPGLLTEERALRLRVEDAGFRERLHELGVLVDAAGLRPAWPVCAW
jgi:hypothetical protein